MNNEVEVVSEINVEEEANRKELEIKEMYDKFMLEYYNSQDRKTKRKIKTQKMNFSNGFKRNMKL